MSDRFHPLSMEQLTSWVFSELDRKSSLFGIPRQAFFVPNELDRFRRRKYGRLLETPFGVAAGPHSQMAQNIVVAWACGSRFIELKTVQTLDEIEVSKPCIDLQDEGYNVEWSQELKVHESFDEYLRAWVLIHALHHKLGFPGEQPGMIFNMSVGYDLNGIQQPNVQWFLDSMRDSAAHKSAYVDIVADWYPEVRDIEIPDTISETVTLSTMHGCPPDEIEKICDFLLTERGLHTSVKCNPTLLGPDGVRGIVRDELGFADVPIPDAAFEHDLRYGDAVPMIRRLRRLAEDQGLVFGVKLTNTLEVENFRGVFERDETMYLSGRPLHAVTTNLAAKLADEFQGELLISFAGGADCFNVSDLLASGMASVTVCSDLLKSGGYMRLLQYSETLDAAMDAAGALDLTDFVCRAALRPADSENLAAAPCDPAELESGLPLERGAARDLARRLSPSTLAGRVVDELRAWSREQGFDGGREDLLAERLVRLCGRINLRRYALQTRSEWRLRKDSFRTDRSKTRRALGLFDCIEAPCVDACAVNQKVPQYMDAVRAGDFSRAVAITRADNPLPTILGRVCDHLCEDTCIRTHFDEPLAIRDLKRFIMTHENEPQLFDRAPARQQRVAIIGGGPAGLSAAERLAYGGLSVTVFEMRPYIGGMVGGAIPTYRLPQSAIDQDKRILDELGVDIRYGVRAGEDFALDQLRAEGFDFIFVAVGAQLAKRLGLPGEDAEGIMDALCFLRSVREGRPVTIGNRVGVVGAGDTAMDCVRSAFRLGAEVSLIYRRTIDQMPADREEIRGAIEEGTQIVELVKPHGLRIEHGRLAGLVCRRMEYRGDHDLSGRKVPHEVPDTEFEIALDTLILAISQHSILDFFGDEMPELTPRGYIRVDPTTFESSLAGVYAGGDVADSGPSSIVEAAADGQRVADSILAQTAHSPAPVEGPKEEAFDLSALLRRRARRQWRVPVVHTPIEERMSFNETTLTYTPEQAMAEASRCLDCHQICSLCVGVCPNLALMTYRSEPRLLELPRLRIEGGETVVEGRAEFRVDQRFQIAVLTDFCNECGNCETFCPTAGKPYVDKPRLYLDRRDFEAQDDNAFLLSRDGEVATLEARWGGETHRIEIGQDLYYRSPVLEARLDPSDFSLLQSSPGEAAAEDHAVSLAACAGMYMLLSSLMESMPELPWAQPDGAPPGTRIGHPGRRV